MARLLCRCAQECEECGACAAFHHRPRSNECRLYLLDWAAEGPAGAIASSWASVRSSIGNEYAPIEKGHLAPSGDDEDHGKHRAEAGHTGGMCFVLK